MDDESSKLIADEEKKSSTTLLVHSATEVANSLRFSKFDRLVRCFVWVMRFYTNAKSRKVRSTF